MTESLMDKKLDYWKHKLLDLGKRNKMINYRETKRTTIKLVEPCFDGLFSRIAVNEDELTFQRAVDKETDIRIFSFLSLLENLSVSLPVTIGDIKTEGSIIERQKTLKNLRAKSRLSLEEQGINILYLSFGFIEWRSGTGTSAQVLKSPIILVPVSLTIDAINSPYKLKKYDDDIVVNPTLSYYFRTEYGIDLPSFDSNDNTIEEYLTSLEKLVDQRGWRIVKESSLGLLSFLKITMYNDLLTNESRIKENRVIRAMAGDTGEINTFPEQIKNYDFDSDKVQNCYQVLSADSSQQDAVLYSKNGVNFVMQGPPGTGKSQTITNIISEALADGKKVLFVSEKMAALQVVYRRLQEVHLADFCLPLHNYKANKKDILDQIGANLNIKQTKVKESAFSELDELFFERSELNAYAKDLHKQILPLNMSCYEVYSKLISMSDSQNISFNFSLPLEISQTKLHSYTNLLNRYSTLAGKIKFCVVDNPWYGLEAKSFGFEYSNKMLQQINECISFLKQINWQLDKLGTDYSYKNDVNFNNHEQLIKMLMQISTFPNVPKHWLLSGNLEKISSQATKAKTMYTEKLSLEENISKLFQKEIYNIDIDTWKSELSEVYDGIIDMPFIKDRELTYFIDNGIALLNIFGAVQRNTSNFDSAIIKTNSILNANFKSKSSSIDFFVDIVDALKCNIAILPIWFEVDNSKIKQMLNDAKRVSIYLQNDDTKKFIEYMRTFLELLYKAQNDISEFLLKISSINSKLGTLFEPTSSSIAVIKDINGIFDKNNTINLNWYGTNRSEIKVLFDKAKDLSNYIKTNEQEILNNWDSDVMNIDYRSILSRYKTEYVSIFKIFNKQYRVDRKLIQSLSINVIKKPDDSVAVDLLQKIKSIVEKQTWFSDNQSVLSESFSQQYSGISSNWNNIENGLLAAQKLDAVFVGNVPDKMKNIFNVGNYSEITSSINQDLEALYHYKNSIDQYCSKIYNTFDFENQKLPEVLKDINNLIEQGEKLCESYNNYLLPKAASKVLVEQKNDIRPLSIFEVEEKTREVNSELDWLETSNSILVESFGELYSGVSTNWGHIEKGISSADLLNKVFNNNVPEELINKLSKGNYADDYISAKEQLQILSDCILKIDNICSENNLSCDFREMNFDKAKSISNLYVQMIQTLLDKYAVVKELMVDDTITSFIVLDSLKFLICHKQLQEKLDKQCGKNEITFEKLFHEEKTDWNELILLISKANDLKKLPIDHDFLTIISSSEEMKRNLAIIAEDLLVSFQQCSEHFVWINSNFSTSNELSHLKISALVQRLEVCLDNIDIIGDWIDFSEVRKDCFNSELSEYITVIENKKLFNTVTNSFLKGFYKKWLNSVNENSVALCRFRRNLQDQRIKKFCELDDKQLLIAQMRIREKLISELPTGNIFLKATDEMTILKKELSKKSRIMPLRKLFKSIPSLLMKLKPCLMMSPLSVSYFLETEAYHFDLIIFDEASQIFPEDAIGAISRGSQVIIAGDSKQLPPTNFFSTSTNNSDNDYDIDDDSYAEEVMSDSILEEAATVLPNRTLLWHYRSKHEHLIAFSNREIYKNSLITFPNCNNNIPDMGVEYIYVKNGYYERGGKNCNIREAQKCVMLVLSHIQNHPERSLGIIAFSEKQQIAIENVIIDFRERMPQYEFFFDESKDEPFFVKNLENVQGDERDTIIFSICYAKDQGGKMYMRFGPLGHKGGERRLNVAITRAKCNIKLVGSILPTDIDLSRTNSEGVKMLKSYIEFACNGETALKSIPKTEEFDSNDDFCDVIATFLEKNGYKIKRHVGCSDYKIDIAVEHPTMEGVIIAGIECDGLSYIQAKIARDRDHLRKNMLQNMGWNLYRIWSTEWIRNTKVEQDELLNYISACCDSMGNVMQHFEQSTSGESISAVNDIAIEVKRSSLAESCDNPYAFEYYREANWYDTQYSDSSDNKLKISETIRYIVSVEQPMHIDLLYKRMGSSFTAGKATIGVKNTIDQVIEQKLKKHVVIDTEKFIQLIPLTPVVVRIPKEYETPRPIEYIHTHEVAVAMVQIIKKAFGISTNELSSECARVFGFERKGPKIKNKTEAAIKYLLDKKIARIVDDKIQLNGV